MFFLVVTTLTSRIPRRNHQVLTTPEKPRFKLCRKTCFPGSIGPKPASISKTRALKLNPPGERKRKRCGPSTKLRRKSLHDCVAGFPGEYLVVECGELFCDACRVEASPKASSLKRHICSNHHVSGKRQRLKEIERASAVNRAIYEQLQQ